MASFVWFSTVFSHGRDDFVMEKDDFDGSLQFCEFVGRKPRFDRISDNIISIRTLPVFSQREAPEDLASSSSKNPHEERKARLTWELEQRKSLDESHKAMVVSQEAMAEEISKKKDYLESLQPKLKTILESTKPVQVRED